VAETVVSQNKVRFSGENPFLRLKEAASGPDTTVCALWRAYFSSFGRGHALFIRSDATDDRVVVLSDNERLLRFVQEIEAILRPPFGDTSLAFTKASFSMEGDPTGTYREIAKGAGIEVELTWHDLYGAFLISVEPGNDVAGDWGVGSCMVPAKRAELTVNGRKARGKAFPEPMAGQACSTAALAFAENWYRAD
jgi:hypothetical protein